MSGARRIISSARMLKEATALKQEGRLGEGMQLAARSVEERVRSSRARLALQGSPLLYRTKSPETKEFEPTPERRAMASHTLGRWVERAGGRDCKTTSDVVRGYYVRPFMEQHGGAFPDEIQNAIARFLQDSEYHERVKVSVLNRAGGSSMSRLGGLGNVPQHVRDGHARHVWLEQQLAANRLFYHVLEKLLKRSQARWDGRPFNMEDFGRLLWPALNDVNALRYSTKTAVMAFGAELQKLYHDPKCPAVRWIDDLERRLEHAE